MLPSELLRIERILKRNRLPDGFVHRIPPAASEGLLYNYAIYACMEEMRP